MLSMNNLQKKRVLRIVNSFGSTSSAYNNFSLPLEDNYEIGICTFNYESGFQLSEKLALYNGNNSIYRFLILLHKACREIRPQVIHAHHPQTAVLSMLYFLLFQRQIPKMYSVHSMFDNYNFYHKLMIFFIAQFYNRIVFCSKSALQSVPSWYVSCIKSEKISVILNCVDLDRIDKTLSGYTANVCGKDTTTFNIINVGRLIEVKNQETLIKTVKKIRDERVTLTIIGGGGLSDKLQVLSQNTESIVLKGSINRDDVFRNLIEANLFVSSSLVEGMPVAVLEAMACRCPIILSDIKPHREITEGIDFVPLISPYDTDDFVDQIKKMMNLTNQERLDIGNRCRKHVEEKFSLSKMLKNYDSVYNDMIGIKN